jgi:hypothetical protein
MISTHVYRAYLIGSPDVELSLIGGQITLDDTQTPHVQATIDVAWPGHWEILPDDPPTAYGGPVWVEDGDTLDALDPRLSPRVRVTTDATYPTFSTSRYFDLGVRDRDPSQRSRVVSMALASDEAILEDHAPLADDDAPFALASSLRDVVEYVLNEAIPGASLEASPAIDADVTPYWSVTNLMPNPTARSIVGNWINGGANGTLVRETGLVGSPISGVTTCYLSSWSGNSGLGTGGAYGQTATLTPYVTATPHGVYTIAVWARSNVAKSVDLKLQIYANDGSVLEGGRLLQTVALAANTWTLIRATTTLPANASRLGPFLYVSSGQQWAAGNTLRTLGWLVHEGGLTVPFFDQGGPDAGYTYTASGAPNESAATRHPDPIERDPEALIWRAGVSAIDFLRPLVQSAGLRLVCDEQRSWTLRDEHYTADGSQNIRYGVNLIDGSDRIRRDSGLWYDGRVTRYRWTDRNGIRQERDDAYALTGSPTRVDLLELDTPYPGPGRSEYAVRRAQTRGREVVVQSVTDWRAHAEQSATFILDGAPTQLGAVSRVVFDLGPGNTRDEMTITARTSDTPEGAWLLGTPDESWLDGTTPETWMEAG